MIPSDQFHAKEVHYFEQKERKHCYTVVATLNGLPKSSATQIAKLGDPSLSYNLFKV